MIEILDRQLNRIAILENAYSDGYEKRFNEVGSQWFTLPLDDPKNEHCNAFNFVKYTLDDEYVGLYRIVPKFTQKSESRNEIEYLCKHVISTLLDSVLFRYHQTTNWTTRQNIEYILSKQNVKHWVLGTCEFERYFHYKFENENGLLAPLFSIPQPFNEEYQWTYDTTVYPFVLNLVKPETEPSCVIREAHNRIGIEKEESNEIVNRIYPLGYGEGVNQLGIEEVNGGVPYIEDAQSIEKYGLQEITWIDRKFETAASLKANAESLLKQWSNPVPMYRIYAADVSPLTGENIDKLKEGRIVRTHDSDLGIFDLRIMSERKDDARGQPGDIQLEVGSLTEDIATVQADLERKMQVNEAYTQGATNVDSHNYVDNCDSNHPAIIRFYLPEDLVNINSMSLYYETEPFRAYSQATEGGGSTVNSTSSGGGTTATSSSGGGVAKSTSSGGGSVVSSSFTAPQYTSFTTPPVKYDGVMPHIEEHYHTFDLGTGLNHSHNVSVPSHSHEFEVPNHSHNLTIPNHSHEITLPDHTHDIKHGIFSLETIPSKVTVKVDGTTITGDSTVGSEINIVPFLEKDDSGRIKRGAWHEVTLTPDGLGRINANIISRLFISSHIGGTY